MKNEQKPVILMVEDEKEVLSINARMLKRRGYAVLTAASYHEAITLLESHIPDLLILDIMLPDGSGFELCRQFRRVSDHPVMFLSGKSETSDRVDSLEMGGDYYLQKPYDPDELLAIANRLTKRHLLARQKQMELTLINKGSLTLDLQKNKASVGGVDAALTAKEFALLLYLVQHEDKEVSPHTLYQTVWGTAYADDIRTVRTHIKNLRKKLGADEAEDFDIVSSYGKGYTFTTVR